MTESLHPHDKTGKTDDVEFLADEIIDPSELERSDLLKLFLSQGHDPAMQAKARLADYIVTTLKTVSYEPWGLELQKLKIDVFDLTEDNFDKMRNQDELFARINDLIIQTKKAAGRNEGLSIERKALFELLDLRAGVTTQFDRSSLMDEYNEQCWAEILDRLVPATA